jgi:hypothetical protein
MKKIVFLLCVILFTGCSPIDKLFGEDEPEFRVIGSSVVTPESDNFFYNALPDPEKRGYDKIKQAAADFEEVITFDDPLSEHQIKKLFKLVYTQEPAVFWLSELASPSEEHNALKINFRYSREDTRAMQTKLEDALREIEKRAPAAAKADEKDAEKKEFNRIRFIHDYIVKNTDFTETGANTNSAYGVFIDGAAQCEGYAFAFSLLAKKLGIPCITVAGTSKDGETHAWNKVYAGGNWYNIDTTWDDPIIEFDNPGYIRYFYMCVPDRDINGITHFEDTQYVTSPPAMANAMNYFTAEKLLFSDSAGGETSLYNQIAKNVLTREAECEIRFDNDKAFALAHSRLFSDGGLQAMISRVNSENSGGIKTAVHSRDDYLYIIHVSLVYY